MADINKTVVPADAFSTVDHDEYAAAEAQAKELSLIHISSTRSSPRTGGASPSRGSTSCSPSFWRTSSRSPAARPSLSA